MYKNLTNFYAFLFATAVVAITAPQQLQAQHTFTTDVRIDGSLAWGLDTPATGSFGFDTAILSENNLRILFDDTSATASFPDNDWRLTANDSSNGGLNHFSIDDATGGTTPFRIEAGARTNALYIEDDGDIGIGTSTPAVDIHVQTGNTPTLRLAQDGSSGFTPQTWDLAGNETNFFVRDATNGSTLPFRIRPGAPTSTIDISASGNLGVGTASPMEKVHVRDTDANFLVENINAMTDLRQLMSLNNNGGVRFSLNNTDSGSIWEFQNSTNGNFQVTLGGTGGSELKITPAGRLTVGPGGFAAMDVFANGNVTIQGTLTQSSDRNKKENFQAVDSDKILEMVSELPITTWSYKSDEEATRHMGPMAQDFHNAFKLGINDKTIAPVDTAGVSLAAIQALNKKVDSMSEEIESKDDKIASLEADLDDMAARMQQMEAALEQLMQK